MKKIWITVPLLLLLFLSCSGTRETTVLDTNNQYIEIEFAFNTEHYPWLLGTKYPQIAIWMESGPDQVKTIFVTEGAGENKWFFAKERPSALPVWSGIRGKEKDGNIDAISGATPSGETHKVLWQLPEDGRMKQITIFVEANVSFDYNTYYSKDASEGNPGFSDVNGQPSVIWSTTFTVDNEVKEVDPTVIGHGHVLGHDYRIDPDMTNVTTAAELFDYIRVFYFPQATLS